MSQPILYHCPDARSLRCLWAVEEAGIDVDLRVLKFPPRAFEPDYRAVNPLMTVPGWVEDGRLLTESAAICERIAEGTALEVRRDEADYWDCRNWLHRSDATLTFPLAIMIRYTRVEPEERRLAQAVADYKAFFGGRARVAGRGTLHDRRHRHRLCSVSGDHAGRGGCAGRRDAGVAGAVHGARGVRKGAGAAEGLNPPLSSSFPRKREPSATKKQRGSAVSTNAPACAGRIRAGEAPELLCAFAPLREIY